MKNLTFLIFFAWKISFCQQFLNGSFEINYLRDCDSLNLSNVQYNSLLDSVNGIGRLEALDLQTDSCSMNIIYTTVDGHFYTSLETGAHDTNSTAISMLLSQPLLMHNTYIMSFYFRSIRNISPFDPVQLIIGYSNNDSTFGASVDTTGMADTVWTKQFVYITPEYNSQYITVMGLPGILSQYTIVDEFSFDTTGLYISKPALPVESIEVFPNPCNSLLTIRTHTTSHLSIYNSLGQQVMDYDVGKNQVYYSLDASNLPNGLYLIQAVKEDKLLVGKFIKY